MWTERQMDDLKTRLWEWLSDEDERQKAADRRARELAQIHRDGWKQTSDAIRHGLGLIADAIRSR